MSVIDVRPSHCAAASVDYALFGSDARRKRALKAAGETRAAAYFSTLESPQQFVALAQARAYGHNRGVEVYSYMQAFSPEEFDLTNPVDVARVNDLGRQTAEALQSADFMVVTHVDSAGGHLHNHIYVHNHDNLTGKGLTRNRSWSRGTRQVNDEVMKDNGCQVLTDPTRPTPNWEQRRESFAEGSYDRVLGDKISAALINPRALDMDSFMKVLADHHGVGLRESQRDGWVYSMRRLDNAKMGRRKASSLADELTKDKAIEIFEYKAGLLAEQATRALRSAAPLPPLTLGTVTELEQQPNTAAKDRTSLQDTRDQLAAAKREAARRRARLLAQAMATDEPAPDRSNNLDMER
ncbi:relaxase/mobilization nuclease domain-containing protein [Demequina iriomotensis]|uniref:relaxase/mobilization nuclease domain-containing protein n=1 Tax=Demequina iriomotensis TaxID=1536641 RepID=UPI00078615D4|nr:relaxase/mobilization nuclease domain-containing protein [Demequina iriomotensis]